MKWESESYIVQEERLSIHPTITEITAYLEANNITLGIPFVYQRLQYLRNLIHLNME
jgi:hypothetical protein